MSGGRQSERIATQKMAIAEEVKTYFKKLVQPLATTASLEEMLKSFSNEVVTKLEKRLDEQEIIIKQQNAKLEEMESRLALRQNTIEKLVDQLEVKSDNLEQYSRRSCLRINGIEVVDGVENINTTLENCYNHIGQKFDTHEIDRAHRIGKTYVDKVTKKVHQSIIVKYKSWGPRTAFYKARPKPFVNGLKIKDALPFTCNLDLTKRRYNLLGDVRGIIKHYPQINFVFADVNCNLGIRFHGDEQSKSFNDKSQLDKILENLDFQE